MAKKLIEVAIVESERGWGQRIDEIKKFKTQKGAKNFIKRFNQNNIDDYTKTGVIPDWYMQAEILQ